MKWMDYNPNPKGRRVEDCAVRAVSKALEISWRDAYLMIAAQGLADGDMMHSDAVWGRVLANHGLSASLYLIGAPIATRRKILRQTIHKEYMRWVLADILQR